ncbi:MAG: hypothetical protein NTX45_08495 [Proteobacteria bacterium]|nr:hypothetical protein [Pseudomonadota bacterium]
MKHSNWGMEELNVAQATGLGERTIRRGCVEMLQNGLQQIMVNDGFDTLGAAQIATDY